MSQQNELYIVGIGASAGGLEAIEKFFTATPGDSGLAFVVVQHLSPDYKSMMTEILGQFTSMPINVISPGMEIEANHIYLIPPRKNVALTNGIFSLTDAIAFGGPNLPIDHFFVRYLPSERMQSP